MSVQMLPKAPPAVGEGGLVHPTMFQWLKRFFWMSRLGIVPYKGIITAYLDADDVSNYFDATGLGNRNGPWGGYAICNGNNGTPDLADKFIRAVDDAAGSTGGTDSGAHTHSTPAHAHQLPLGWDGTNLHLGQNAGDTDELYGSTDETHNRIVAAHGGAATASGTISIANSNTDGSGTSGAASATDNRPAFYELVALMNVGGYI